MKSITINGTTFIEITTSEGEGILIHDETDINQDGDAITANTCWLPETEEDARIILNNESWATSFHVKNGIYYFD